MRGDTRRSIQIGLAVAAVAVAAIAVVAAIRSWGSDGPTAAAIGVIVLAGIVLAALWAVQTHADHHFDSLERLRGDIVMAAGADRELPQRWAEPDARGEAVRLAGAAARILARQKTLRSLPDDRLVAVLGAVAEGIVVTTDSGLISLANASAMAQFDESRLAPGHSIYGVFERDGLNDLVRAARSRGKTSRGMLRTIDGEDIEARVADLGHHRGTVISLPGCTFEAYRPTVVHALHLHDDPPASVPVTDDTALDEIDALVLDTETTGLDVDSDRIVAIGGVIVHGRRIYPHESIDRLVNPGRPIPAAATAVNGITDAMIGDAPPIETVLPDVLARCGGRALIGHNIGFDVAILHREAARTGATGFEPPTLDTALLMAALFPDLKAVDLEVLAKHFEVEISGRHTALGDALVTAEIFVRMIPVLQDAGVRTCGEARAFAQRARYLYAQQRQAGWHRN